MPKSRTLRLPTHIALPGVSVKVPEPKSLAYMGGLAGLAVVGIMEWPVAAAVVAGYILATDHHSNGNSTDR
jgi:hypothetical protein